MYNVVYQVYMYMNMNAHPFMHVCMCVLLGVHVRIMMLDFYAHDLRNLIVAFT